MSMNFLWPLGDLNPRPTDYVPVSGVEPDPSNKV